MCVFKPPDVKPQPLPPAIAPRVQGKQELPQAQTLVKEGEQADIQIGSSGKKETGEAAAQKTGPDSLKIKLNKPGADQKTASQGGLTIT